MTYDTREALQTMPNIKDNLVIQVSVHTTRKRGSWHAFSRPETYIYKNASDSANYKVICTLPALVLSASPLTETTMYVKVQLRIALTGIAERHFMQGNDELHISESQPVRCLH